ncbi:hypothetical protein [Vibrio coralliilyticus]|uniref:Uncharacterized protein n=1 Tax=Vibrio coralliilyticus TaxID=190893 RepID=A0AAP7DEK1_9VIBR|nr:hypothetical protein [Vibrio coralliilyticus]NOI31824.1 hypothetical protein [Vibrio coralliilyticus]NOJ25268.1 hypothetical protein [Vibrio coralliilyticus]
MIAISYENNGKEEVVKRFGGETKMEDAVRIIKSEFPDTELLVDGNRFKWLKSGEKRLLISVC